VCVRSVSLVGQSSVSLSSVSLSSRRLVCRRSVCCRSVCRRSVYRRSVCRRSVYRRSVSQSVCRRSVSQSVCLWHSLTSGGSTTFTVWGETSFSHLWRLNNLYRMRWNLILSPLEAQKPLPYEVKPHSFTSGGSTAFTVWGETSFSHLWRLNSLYRMRWNLFMRLLCLSNYLSVCQPVREPEWETASTLHLSFHMY